MYSDESITMYRKSSYHCSQNPLGFTAVGGVHLYNRGAWDDYRRELWGILAAVEREREREREGAILLLKFWIFL